MEGLVTMEKNIIWADSRIIAEKYNSNNHYQTKRVILKVMKDYEIKPDLRSGLIDEYDPLIIQKKDTYRNQEFDYYLLNKSAFILLAMRFKTKEARYWQKQFVKAFCKMEKVIARQQNAEWIEARKQGMVARKQETDTIKEFVEYATNQGSKNAKFYYSNLTKATYKALGLLQQKIPNIRNMLDVFQINELFTAEDIVSKGINKYMLKEMHYRDIYESVKKDLEQYAQLIDIKGPKQLKVGK
jgi:phage regulator Rha-like protein